MVQWKDLPPEVPKQVASFLKQSEMSNVVRTSTQTKSDVYPVLQQRKKQIHQQYSDFFQQMATLKKKPRTEWKTEMHRLLRELRHLVKTKNPNTTMQNGHTPLYHFIKVCVTNEFVGLPLGTFLRDGLNIFIQHHVNVNRDPSLVPFLLRHHYSIPLALYKAKIIIKERDLVFLLKNNALDLDSKLKDLKPMMVSIFHPRRSQRGLSFDFNYVSDRLNLMALISQYILVPLCKDVRTWLPEEWKEAYEYTTHLIEKINQKRNKFLG